MPVEALKKQEAAFPTWADFELKSFIWEKGDSNKDQKKHKQTQEARPQEIICEGGQILVLKAKKEISYRQDSTEKTQEKIVLTLGSDQSKVEIEIYINYFLDPPVIETCILKEDEQGELPPRIGAGFYEKVLVYLRSLANENNKIYRHREYRDPELCPAHKEPLPEAKWNEIFLPLYKRHGYQESHPYWEKIYKPE